MPLNRAALKYVSLAELQAHAIATSPYLLPGEAQYFEAGQQVHIPREATAMIPTVWDGESSPEGEKKPVDDRPKPHFFDDRFEDLRKGVDAWWPTRRRD